VLLFVVTEVLEVSVEDHLDLKAPTFDNVTTSTRLTWLATLPSLMVVAESARLPLRFSAFRLPIYQRPPFVLELSRPREVH